MKNIKPLVILTISVAFATAVLQAAPITTPITQADIDALDSSDIIWNAQFFPSGGTLDEAGKQYTVGSGLTGEDLPYGGTTWVTDPGVNSLSVGITGGGSLEASANSGDTVIHGVTGVYNEIWIFLREQRSADLTDYMEVSNLSIDGNSLPDLRTDGLGAPSFKFVGYKVTLDNFPSNIGEFNLTGDLSYQLNDGAVSKEWNFNTIGVNAIPEPSSIVLLLLAIGIFLISKKK